MFDQIKSATSDFLGRSRTAAHVWPCNYLFRWFSSRLRWGRCRPRSAEFTFMQLFICSVTREAAAQTEAQLFCCSLDKPRAGALHLLLLSTSFPLIVLQSIRVQQFLENLDNMWAQNGKTWEKLKYPGKYFHLWVNNAQYVNLLYSLSMSEFIS